MRHLRARPCSPAPGRLCEGPVWDPAIHELLWVDITAGLIHRGSLVPFADGSGLPDVLPRITLAAGGPVGAVLPSRSGALIAPVSTSVMRIGDSGRLKEIASLPLPRTAYDDGSTTPRATPAGVFSSAPWRTTRPKEQAPSTSSARTGCGCCSIP
ncbi:SMP-30/gluconolactonase/LRE family protein [Streptomyces venezuelae ATCC 10712]